jgi:hypothetical protein
MSVSPLSDAAVNRIVTAVNRKPTSLAHLAELLAEARFEYFCRRILDIEHTASKQRAALASLERAVSRFGSALNKYDNDGRPGWAFVESSAELNLSRLRDDGER